MGKKKVIKNQKYESYWSLTLEYSDFSGEQFNNVLSIIVEFIDKYVDKTIGITSSQYSELQNIIENIYPKRDSASTRKSINQFFKLGFINNKGCSYHHLTKAFLSEHDKEEKRLIYSKIVYDNASFSRSYSNESNKREIKFLINTLEECGKISREELLAVIFTNIDDVPKGYLTKEELKRKYAEVLVDNTAGRKYNQRNYLFNLCSNLTDIYVAKDIMSLNPDLLLDNREKSKVRDSYLQRLYKIELIKESMRVYNTSKGKCVLEHLAYPILIASHIKPYRVCDENEQFDKENGLLLSKNMDSLFDNGYITFDDDGTIIPSNKLDKDVAKHLENFKLDSIIYTQKRRNYMQYHREHVFLI